MNTITPARIVAQLRLALLGDCGCLKTLSDLNAEAKEQGLTGAEIDTALSGRSFEARSDAAIAYGCAVKADDPDAIAAAGLRAARLGLTEDELAAIARTTRDILQESAR